MTTIETVQINAQGQLTLPESTRQKHGWDADTKLQLIDEGEKIILQKAAPESEFKQWLRQVAGSANAGLTTDEIMEMTRGED